MQWLHGEGDPEGEGWLWVEEVLLLAPLPTAMNPAWFSLSPSFIFFSLKFFGYWWSLFLVWCSWHQSPSALPKRALSTRSSCSDGLSPSCWDAMNQHMRLPPLQHAIHRQSLLPRWWKWHQDNEKLVLHVGVSAEFAKSSHRGWGLHDLQAEQTWDESH